MEKVEALKLAHLDVNTLSSFLSLKRKKLNNIFCLISLFIYKRAFKKAQFLSHNSIKSDRVQTFLGRGCRVLVPCNLTVTNQ